MRRERGEARSSCSISYQSYIQRTIESKKIVLDVISSKDAITFVEPADALCDFQNCYVYKADKFMYLDNNHLSVAGAKIVIDNAKVLRGKLNDK